MIERVRGIVESVDESGLVLRTGDFCIRLMASRNLTARLVAGRTEDLPVQLVVQLEGNRLTPILIAFADDIERDVYEAPRIRIRGGGQGRREGSRQAGRGYCVRRGRW